jgi:integrase
MEKACMDRGKPSKAKAEGVGRITYERGFHSLRHTFTTWLRVGGVERRSRSHGPDWSQHEGITFEVFARR